MRTGSTLAYAISMEDARLIARLRRGERVALAGLWEAWADPIWAVCVGMTASDEEARTTFLALHRALREDARCWGPAVPLPCLMAATVCRQLARRMRLPQPDTRPRALPSPSRPLEAHEIRAALATIPGPERLVLLADLFFECPIESLSGLLAVPEENLRLARSTALWRLTPGGPGRGARGVLWRLPDLACEDPPAAETERLTDLLQTDPEMEARLEALAQARDLARAVLAQAAPDLPSLVPLGLVPPPSEPDPLGVLGGLLVGLAVVLATFSLALVRPSPAVAFAGPLAAHQAAVGHAPGFIPATDPASLRAALLEAGAPPSRASVADGAALRLKLTGGMLAPTSLGGVALYTLDGRPITSQTVVAPPQAGMPDQAWEVRGASLRAWQLGQTGVVVVSEPAVGRTRVFASALPPGELLALLAYGVKIGAPL